jgi:hypothetical protein
MYRIGYFLLVISRIASLGILGYAGYHVFTVMTTGEGVMLPDVYAPESTMAFVIGFALMGLAMAWYRERMGGWWTTIGMVIFLSAEYLWSYTLPGNEIYMAILICGLMFVFSSAIIGGYVG